MDHTALGVNGSSDEDTRALSKTLMTRMTRFFERGYLLHCIFSYLAVYVQQIGVCHADVVKLLVDLNQSITFETLKTLQVLRSRCFGEIFWHISHR
jgi:hypothetical protein